MLIPVGMVIFFNEVYFLIIHYCISFYKVLGTFRTATAFTFSVIHDIIE